MLFYKGWTIKVARRQGDNSMFSRSAGFYAVGLRGETLGSPEEPMKMRDVKKTIDGLQ